MNPTTMIFGAPSWLLPALLLVAIGGVLLWSGYRLIWARRGAVRAASVLKAVALLLLGLLLAEPLLSGIRARPQANLFVVLTDTSRSLTAGGTDGAPTPAEAFHELTARDTFGKSPKWLTRLGQDFDLRLWRFDRNVSAVESYDELEFDGDASSLHEALETLRDRYRNQPLAGILLLSDGRPTDADGTLRFDGIPPVYPVLPEGTVAVRDLALTHVGINQTPFEDAPVTVRATADAQGLPEGDVVAELRDVQGNVAATETRRLDGETASFRLQLRPKSRGVSFYQLRVKAAQEDDSPAELTTANNKRLIAVDRGERKRRILYVSGRPNWEFKFLNRAIQEDDQIDLVGLIRVARREAKFDWRGRAGERKNSFFRGFDNQDDPEAENYDEPVLVRLNTRDAEELRRGFPADEESLFTFDAVILDDVEASFFRAEQLALIKRYVSERGGGLLMLGGMSSFEHGRYDKTPVGDLLPVYQRASAGRPTKPYRLDLTREGWLQPWVRLYREESAERDRIEKMPQFRSVNRVVSIKPGAAVMASVTDAEGQPWPALVTQRFGRGRTGAVLIGDLWRWQLAQKEDRDDLAKAWRQTLRWLVSDVPERVAVEIEPHPGGRKVRVRARDESFQPLENATVTMKVTGPGQEPLTVEAEASLDELGTYTAVLPSTTGGAYRLELKVTDGDGQDVGTTRTGWAENPNADEFRRVGVDRKFLEDLAASSGGVSVPIDSLDDFVADLPHRASPVSEAWTQPLWDSPWLFVVVVGLLVGEWGLRRYRGLP